MPGLKAVLALAISMHGPQALPPTPSTLPLGEIREGDLMALARQALPPETAAGIVGGYVRRQWIPGQHYFIRLDERPVVHSPDLCRRLSYFGEARSAATETAAGDTPLELQAFTPSTLYAATYPIAADDAACQTATGWISTPPDRPEPTLRMLARLMEAMRLAAGDAPLPFDIACVAETSYSTSGPCPDSRRALADLPLASLLAVRLQNTVYQDEPVRNGVRLRRMQPVPDDRWPQAQVEFDASPPDGRSWTVVLKGVDRLDAVEMRRTTIIRH